MYQFDPARPSLAPCLTLGCESPVDLVQHISLYCDDHRPSYPN